MMVDIWCKIPDKVLILAYELEFCFLSDSNMLKQLKSILKILFLLQQQ